MRIHRTKMNSSDDAAGGNRLGVPFGAVGGGNPDGANPAWIAEADGAADPDPSEEAATSGGSEDDGDPAPLDFPEHTLDLGQRPWDPAEVKSSRPARVARVLAGVTESLLDRIPTERSRYTALACVMMCTATVSGISMFFALTEVFDFTSPWFFPFGLFWAGFILSVDRWLVSAAPSKHSFARLQTLLLRLGIAVILGFIIAEPLLLRVFQTEVVNEVATERTAATNYGIEMYKECNPTSGQAPTGLGCADWTLSVSGSAPASDQDQIDSLNADISRLTGKLAAENSTLQGLAQTVRDECNGVSGPGLTGHVGDGPACQSDERAYEDYKNAQPIAQQNEQLSADETQLSILTAKKNSDTTAVAGQITDEINQWAARQPTKSTTIGLIDRFNALIELSGRSVVVNVGAWLLRLFFVSIDCMPVLVKFIGGATPYDEFARREINIAHNVLEVEGRTRVDVAEIQRSLRLKWEHARAAQREQEFNAAVRDHAATIEARQWEAIDREYEQKLSRMGIEPDRMELDSELELVSVDEASAEPEPFVDPDPGPREASIGEISTLLSDTPTTMVNGWAGRGAAGDH